MRKAENERKIKELEAKNTQGKEIIDKLLAGDVDMELMEKLLKEELKLKLVLRVQHLEEEILKTLVSKRNSSIATLEMRMFLLYNS